MSTLLKCHFLHREDRDDSIHLDNKQAVTEAGIHTLLFEAVRNCTGDVEVLLDIVNTITCLADMGECQFLIHHFVSLLIDLIKSIN